MSEKSAKKKDKRRSSRLPTGTAGLMSTLGEKGRGIQIKPLIIITLVVIFAAVSVLLLILGI